MTEPPHYAASDVLRSLTHEVRGHLSRLHLRLSMPHLAAAAANDALAELARIELSLRTHQDLVREPPNRARELRSLHDMVKQVLVESDNVESVELDPSLNFQVNVWPELVHGVARALIANGRQHGLPPIVVSASQTDDCWILTVSDSGSGFERAHAGKCASSKSQLKVSHTLSGGVGLIAADRLASLLGGAVSVQSADGHCAVSLCCPVA